MVDYTNPKNRQNSNAGLHSAARGTSSVDQGLRTHMLKVYNDMALGLGISGVVAYAVMAVPGFLQAVAPLYWVFALVELGLVIYLSARIFKMSETKARTTFFIYAAINGLTLGVIFSMYTMESVARVFFITAALFGAMSLYGYTTKRSLEGFGTFLMMGLIGIIIASLVNLFLQSSALHYAVSFIGVFIFIGLTAYDTQKIKSYYYQFGSNSEMLGKTAIMGALALYLDFINLMIMLLQFFGNRD